MDLTSRRDFLKQLAAGVGLTMTAGPLDLFAGFAPVGRRPNYYQGADRRRHDAITFAREI